MDLGGGVAQCGYVLDDLQGQESCSARPIVNDHENIVSCRQTRTRLSLLLNHFITTGQQAEDIKYSTNPVLKFSRQIGLPSKLSMPFNFVLWNYDEKQNRNQYLKFSSHVRLIFCWENVTHMDGLASIGCQVWGAFCCTF